MPKTYYLYLYLLSTANPKTILRTQIYFSNLAIKICKCFKSKVGSYIDKNSFIIGGSTTHISDYVERFTTLL